MYCEGTGAFGHMLYLVRECIWLVLPALSLTLRVYPLPSMGNSTQNRFNSTQLSFAKGIKLLLNFEARI